MAPILAARYGSYGQLQKCADGLRLVLTKSGGETRAGPVFAAATSIAAHCSLLSTYIYLTYPTYPTYYMMLTVTHVN